MARKQQHKEGQAQEHRISLPVVATAAAVLVLLVALCADSTWFETARSAPVVDSARRPGKPTKPQPPQQQPQQQQRKTKALREPASARDKDEVAMTEYHFEALNRTLQMKQNWWHAHEASAGTSSQKAGSPAPMWEASFAVADFLSRQADPWSAFEGSIGALRPEGAPQWSWKEALAVVVGAEIGLTTAALGLLGSAVVTVDSSMRLLEAAKRNVWGNLGSPRRIAMRKTLWGSPLNLEGLTGGQKKTADLVVVAHATCAGALDAAVMRTAESITGSDTLLVAAFAGGPVKDCAELRAMSATHEIAR